MMRLFWLSMTTAGSIAILSSCSDTPVLEMPWEEFHVTATINTNSIRIGEPVLLRIQVDHRPGINVDLPTLERDSLVIHALRSTTETLKETQLRTISLCELTSFDIGTHVISTNHVVFSGFPFDIQSRLFPFVSLDVRSSMTNDQVFVEDFGLVAWPSAFPRLFVGLILVGIFAFAVAGIVVWIFKHRRNLVGSSPKLPPPHLIALKAIERLKKRRYLEKSGREPFFIELSAIVRHYIEARFDVAAPDLTTEEFIETAGHSTRLSAGHHELIRVFLEQSDLVKFARVHPNVAAMDRALEAAIQLIEETQERGESQAA